MLFMMSRNHTANCLRHRPPQGTSQPNLPPPVVSPTRADVFETCARIYRRDPTYTTATTTELRTYTDRVLRLAALVYVDAGACWDPLQRADRTVYKSTHQE